jgi:phage-related protein
MAEGFRIAEGFVEIASRINESRNRRNAEKAGDDAAESFTAKMGKKLVSSISSSVLPAIGAVLNLGLAAVPAFAGAAVAIWHVVSAAGAAAPALIALGVAGGLVKLTLTAIMPAIQKSLDPIAQAFKSATTEASALATKGVRPLAAEFARVNMPQVSAMMNNIAYATNGVVTSTLKWLNTVPGMQAVTNITSATGSAVLRLRGPLEQVVQSFIAMVGRIAGVSLAAGSGGLAGVLQKLSGWMDRVTSESVQAGLDKLKSSFLAVKGAVETVAHWIGVAVGFYRQYRTEINLISDALGILAIVFGGPVTAIIALVGMVIRHFDLIRSAYQNLMTSFQNSTQGPAFLNNLKAAADIVVPALVNGFHEIWDAIGPILKRIWNQITTQLVPAFGEFVLAMAPVVKFFIDRLVPVISTAMKTVLTVISGVIDIITGIFKVFTGILRGDWSKVWEGIKQILRGAVTIIVGILKGLVGLVRGALSNLGAVIAGIFRGAVNLGISALGAIVGRVRSTLGRVRGAVTGALSGAGGWLRDAGRRIIQGLIDGIQGMLGSLRGTLGNITGMIPDWKGPAERDAKLLTPAGTKIMSGLMAGIAAQLPALRAQLGGITSDIPDLALAGSARAAVRAPQAATAPSSTSSGGGTTVGELHVHLQGILDPTNPTALRKLAAQLYELLKGYERSYA